VREILTELEGLVAGGPTDQEVSAARDFAAGVFGLQLETVGQIASRVAQLVIYGLHDAYYHEYRDRMREVTTAAAHAAVRHHMRPAEAQIVVVGDADSVAGALQELGVAPVEVEQGQPRG
jgi:zinc protease